MKDLVRYLPGIHKEGLYFIIGAALLAVILSMLHAVLGMVGVLTTIYMLYFFRDPERVSPIGDDFVVAPSDGVVEYIEEATPPEELELGNEKRLRISVFLSVFDIHVNRIPASGKITKEIYNPGYFHNATLEKASRENERQSMVMQTTKGQELVFVQIAGKIARRIVCDLEEGQKVTMGERFGIIRFGSRMDVYLPKGSVANVMIGQRAVAGETILGHLNPSKAKTAPVKAKPITAKQVRDKKPAAKKKAPAKKAPAKKAAPKKKPAASKAGTTKKG